MIKKLTLQEHFDFHLQSVKLDKSALSEKKYKEMKRAFAAGMTQMALLSSLKSRQDAIDALNQIMKELKYFWDGERINVEQKFKP